MKPNQYYTQAFRNTVDITSNKVILFLLIIGHYFKASNVRIRSSSILNPPIATVTLLLGLNRFPHLSPIERPSRTAWKDFSPKEAVDLLALLVFATMGVEPLASSLTLNWLWSPWWWWLWWDCWDAGRWWWWWWWVGWWPWCGVVVEAVVEEVAVVAASVVECDLCAESLLWVLLRWWWESSNSPAEVADKTVL